MWWLAVFFLAGRAFPAGPAAAGAVISISTVLIASALSATGLKCLSRAAPGARVRASCLMASAALVLMSAGAPSACERGSSRTLAEKAADRARAWMSRRIEESPLSPGARSLSQALVLADRSGIYGRLTEDYSFTGISHFLALSGLHLGMIALSLSAVLKRTAGGGAAGETLLTGITGAYVLVAGSPPSLVRAWWMLVLLRFSRLAGIRLSLWKTLVCSGLVIAAADAGMTCRVGFQLSFLAVAGIALFGLPLRKALLGRRRPGRLADYAVSVVLITLSVQLYTTPVLLERFGRAPLCSALPNLVMTLPVMAALALGLVNVFLPGGLLRSLAAMMLEPVSALLWELPGRMLPLGRPALYRGWLHIPAYIAFVAVLSASVARRCRWRRGAAALSALLLAIAIAAGPHRSAVDAGSCRAPSNGAPYLLEGEPDIAVVPGRLTRRQAELAVRDFWMAGRGGADVLVVVLPDQGSLTGLEYMISRMSPSLIVCSPYLAGAAGGEDLSLGSENARTVCRDTLLANASYRIRVSAPPYPPLQGTAVDGRAASLTLEVKRMSELPEG